MVTSFSNHTVEGGHVSGGVDIEHQIRLHLVQQLQALLVLGRVESSEDVVQLRFQLEELKNLKFTNQNHTPATR